MELQSHPTDSAGLLRRADEASLWLWPGLANAALLLVTAGLLRLMGRLWWCVCGGWQLWYNDAWGAHASQHGLDPYSVSHLTHGVLLWWLLAWLCPRMPFRWQLVWATGLECAWEVLENTPFVIDRYRTATAAQGYYGDSVVNAVADVLACVVGFWIASRLRFWKSLAFFVALELVLLFWIRDNVILNVIMLLWPSEAIEAWQLGG